MPIYSQSGDIQLVKKYYYFTEDLTDKTPICNFNKHDTHIHLLQNLPMESGGKDSTEMQIQS